jgi:hypothetical protein
LFLKRLFDGETGMTRSILAAALCGLALAASAQTAVAAATCRTGWPPQPAKTFPPVTGRLVFQAADLLYLTTIAASRITTTAIQCPTGLGLTLPRNANFSPDGKWIVFSADTGVTPTSSGRRDIYVSTPSGAHLVNLTNYQDGTTPDEDGRFSPDGKEIVFKQGYWVNGVERAHLLAMQVNLPAQGDPQRIGMPTVLVPDKVFVNPLTGQAVEASQPDLSTNGRYVFLTEGTGSGEGIFRYDTQRGTIANFAVTTGLERFYPIVRDAGTVFFEGWIDAATQFDQLFMKSSSINSAVKLLPVNDCMANNSDPAPVGQKYVIFSSNRLGKGMRLFIGEIASTKYWDLGINPVSDKNVPYLGPNFTNKQ